MKKLIISNVIGLVCVLNIYAQDNLKLDILVGGGYANQTNNSLLNIGMNTYYKFQSNTRLGLGTTGSFSRDDSFLDAYLFVGQSFGKYNFDLVGGVTHTAIGYEDYYGETIGCRIQREIGKTNKIEISYQNSTLDGEYAVIKNFKISRINLNYIFSF